MLSLDCEVPCDSYDILKLVQSDGNAVSLWLIPEADIQSTPAALVHASLAFSLLRSHALGYHINTLMVLAINLLVPDGQSPKSPENYVQLSRLKQVYSGDFCSASMTVKDIEKAVSALSEHQYAERLDCDVVLVNIMRSVAELVFDRDHPLHLAIDEKVTLLLLMERRAAPSLRTVRSKVRRQMFAIARNSFATQAETRNSSTESFHLIERVFRELRINRPNDGSSRIDDQETLEVFEKEVLKELSQYGFKTNSDDHEASYTQSFGTYPAIFFQEAFGDMFASYAKFKADVYGTPLSSWTENVSTWLTVARELFNIVQPPIVPRPGFGAVSCSVPVLMSNPLSGAGSAPGFMSILPLGASAMVQVLLN
ncbi:hypothetical protein FRC00_000239 [Tulasnella sp. 408]|nr:hypothetical protein FRC00_000239 [Tulasnella sp. 408]